jgi:hypothetical protein
MIGEIYGRKYAEGENITAPGRFRKGHFFPRPRDDNCATEIYDSHTAHFEISVFFERTGTTY